RRRHTRFSRDWSSDVCSSDLERGAVPGVGQGGSHPGLPGDRSGVGEVHPGVRATPDPVVDLATDPLGRDTQLFELRAGQHEALPAGHAVDAAAVGGHGNSLERTHVSDDRPDWTCGGPRADSDLWSNASRHARQAPAPAQRAGTTWGGPARRGPKPHTWWRRATARPRAPGCSVDVLVLPVLAPDVLEEVVGLGDRATRTPGDVDLAGLAGRRRVGGAVRGPADLLDLVVQGAVVE